MKHTAKILAGLLALIPLVARAQESVIHAVTVHGVVRHVDYANGTVELQAKNGHTFKILTSPSTTITGAKESGYEELSDVRPGAHVTVEASRSNAQLDASLIEIHDAR